MKTSAFATKYSDSIVKCWTRIGFYGFSHDVSTYPWSGRSALIARRQVIERYIEANDVLAALWVHERAKRVDANWYAADPGMSYISSLLRSRSAGRWLQEVDELAATLPTIFDYMDHEWGSQTRAHLAQVRRSEFHLIDCGSDRTVCSPAQGPNEEGIATCRLQPAADPR